ncbi:MAG TPA: NAD(P)H-binding protein [Moraxellaceae bacterium]|nr:NAD(P)H-binding protein [Moraxellaceae bacterium]
MPAKSGKTAILIGATGLVGAACLASLLESPAYRRVIAVSRRPVPVKHRKLVRVETAFDHLGSALEGQAADDAFCCLGTTIRQAGTKAEFHKVDYGYALAFADAARRQGASHFLLVSALGANAHSPIFYNRVKGLLEKEVEALAYPRLSIFRPSLLLGSRQDARPGEALGIRFSGLVSPFLRGPLSRLHPVAGADLGAALVACAVAPGPEGPHRYYYDDILGWLAR